jgi:hypothetical protein
LLAASRFIRRGAVFILRRLATTGRKPPLFAYRPRRWPASAETSLLFFAISVLRLAVPLILYRDASSRLCVGVIDAARARFHPARGYLTTVNSDFFVFGFFDLIFLRVGVVSQSISKKSIARFFSVSVPASPATKAAR